MTRKRFHYSTQSLTDDLSSDGVSVADSEADYAEEFYHRVGSRFPVRWESQSRAEPIIDTDDLPQSVSESDVESALSTMIDNGIL